MKKSILSIFSSVALTLSSFAQSFTAAGPDGQMLLHFNMKDGKAFYSVEYAGKQLLEESPMGFKANVGDFSSGLKMIGHETENKHVEYSLDRIKKSSVNHDAIEVVVHLENSESKPFDVRFHLSNNDIAFRYELQKFGETGSVRIMEEQTGFRFPLKTTTYICPQSEAMIGWKRTKPSYEEEYVIDAPMDLKSQFGKGYTFPGLFRVENDGWILVSETGVDSRYCASHLSDYMGDGLYTIAMPLPEENNGNGTTEPAFSLPGATPWRTLTVGSSLKPIVETTIAYDVVEQLYASEHKYKYGKGTWSWILWQDESINFEDQKKYIDFSAAMNFQYALIDNWWDLNIGREGIEKLVEYAKSKGVEIFLWYSSSGYWNDIVQGPVNCMDNSIIRKQQMRWMKKIGVKGIKVDFFGGDKQETIRLYEQILSDADDNGLMVIFHGCTLPRGWERMYPNYVGSEAVLASENMIFSQHFCDGEAVNATLHPFIRNTVGCMEWGGCFMNRRMHRSNNSGNTRRTTDVFELATTVLFQNPIQNFALAPNNLDDAPALCIDYLREVPTIWDETVFIDGCPGKYIALARRSGDVWYVAAINAEKTPLTVELDLSMFAKGDKVSLYSDNKNGAPELKDFVLKNPSKTKFTIQPQGGLVIRK